MLTFLGVCRVYAQELPTVKFIEIKGLKRIEEAAVKSKITQKSGLPLSNEKTTNDIKSIYKMGYFDDVKVDLQSFEGGIKLIYVVKEKPTIIKIDFQGNEEMEDSKLKDKIKLFPNAIADTALIQDNAEYLRAFYEEEGYWLANITPVINKINEDEVTLTYQIEEGSKVKIRKIIIEGTKGVSEGSVKGAMKTSTWWIFSFLTSSGYYKKVEMYMDIERIKDFYLSKGYLNITVGEPKIDLIDGKTGMKITIKVSEGDQYRISSLDVSGNKFFAKEELLKKVETEPKEVFNMSVLRKDIATLTEMHTEKGYAVANVYPDIIPDDAAKKAKIDFKINEGDIYKIGRIEVIGNTKTLDKVVRREFRLNEGERYNSVLLKRTKERIDNLNFFETVDLNQKPKPEEKLVNVDLKVKDKPTGALSVGGGYSSVDKVIGTVEITQRNLFGRGQFVRLKGDFGSRSTTYELSFREPWLFDKPISFGAGIYSTKREYFGYSQKAKGFDISFGKTFAEYWEAEIMYNFEKSLIYDLDNNPSDLIKEQEGSHTTSKITPAIVRDSRDNFLDPHKGSRNLWYITYAGLGGNTKFVKTGVDSAWFFPFYSTTFMLRGRYGAAAGIDSKPLPIYERFYIGGIYTIRGIGYGQIGTKDDKGNTIGGEQQLIFNAEYIFPIVKELKFNGLVFFDTGSAFDSRKQLDMKYTSGLGVRWISPIGPIRFEWGYNLKQKEGESKSKFEFTFGAFF